MAAYGEMSVVLSTRIPVRLRLLIDAARKKSGLSISSEVRIRMDRSFVQDRIQAAFLAGVEIGRDPSIIVTKISAADMDGESIIVIPNANQT